MNLLESSAHNSVNVSAKHTAMEITQQPDLWREIWQMVNAQQESIKHFLDNILSKTDVIILTGAGTSAYIGISAQSSFQRSFNKITNSISTTHLVSHPDSALLKDKTTLLVSFARSGNSPESEAAIHLTDDLCKECHHLIITCNKEGALAKADTKHSKYIFNLPDRSNDKSLAMTSSFSGMLLAALLISRIDQISDLEEKVSQMATYANQVIDNSSSLLKEIAQKPFTRSVFLGSGPFYGIATEAQLKMQELTDGIVVGKHDSFLGLRHGPKAVIDGETLVFYHFSNNKLAAKYEMDLVQAMKDNSSPMCQVGVTECSLSYAKPLDSEIVLGKSENPHLEEDFLAVVSIVPAQILAYFKSLDLGLSPDSPSRNGAISRVVQGVTIYNDTLNSTFE